MLRNYALQKQGVVLYVSAAAHPCPNYAQKRPNYVSTMFQLWLNYVSTMVELWFNYELAIQQLSNYVWIMVQLCFNYDWTMVM